MILNKLNVLTWNCVQNIYSSKLSKWTGKKLFISHRIANGLSIQKHKSKKDIKKWKPENYENNYCFQFDLIELRVSERSNQDKISKRCDGESVFIFKNKNLITRKTATELIVKRLNKNNSLISRQFAIISNSWGP